MCMMRVLRISLMIVASLLPLRMVLSQSTSTNKGAAKAKPALQEAAVYIPSDLQDSLRILRKSLNPDDIKRISAAKEKDVVHLHMSLGLTLRNRWGLWRGSRLAKYFNSIGVHHPDDMSGIVLTSLWRQLHQQPIHLQEQVKVYQDYWKAIRVSETQEQRRVVRVKAKIERQMLGLRFASRPAPVFRLPRRINDGLRIRSMVRFRNGLLLTTKEYKDSTRLASGSPDFSTPCYYLDLHHKVIHPIRVAEMDSIEGGVVAGGTFYLNGARKGRTRLIGIGKQRRFFLPEPPGKGWLRLGQDGEKLLGVRPHGVYRWTGQSWQTLCSTSVTLPLTAVPPVQIGRKIYFRDEGVNEDDKRLSWIDLMRPHTLTYFDEEVGVVGPSGPRWENVHSFGATSNNSLWIATGSYVGTTSLVLRRVEGSYSIGLFNGNTRAIGGLLNSESPEASPRAEAIDVTGVRTMTKGHMIVVGAGGLYRIRAQSIHPIVRFNNTQQAIPEDGVVSHWEWLPTHIMSLERGDFVLGGHFGGTYLLKHTRAGQFRLVTLDEKLGQSLRL